MKAAKLKCFFGLHDYETVRTVQNIMSASIMYIEGDVCRCCGQMKRNHQLAARHMYTMCSISPFGKTTVHPAVFGNIEKETT